MKRQIYNAPETYTFALYAEQVMETISLPIGNNVDNPSFGQAKSNGVIDEGNDPAFSQWRNSFEKNPLDYLPGSFSKIFDEE